jgi:hypothetical protein
MIRTAARGAAPNASFTVSCATAASPRNPPAWTTSLILQLPEELPHRRAFYPWPLHCKSCMPCQCRSVISRVLSRTSRWPWNVSSRSRLSTIDARPSFALFMISAVQLPSRCSRALSSSNDERAVAPCASRSPRRANTRKTPGYGDSRRRFWRPIPIRAHG